MAESFSDNFKRVASRGGWKRFFLHALAMLVLSWLVFIIATAIATDRVPVSFRDFVMSSAQASGYYVIPLVISWIVLRFNKISGWVAWVLLVGLLTFGVLGSHAA
ncbi:hypothetical protein [Xanthomonas graminis]|uniref:hypothetical protein n=1 Tax=Xanthomonas graminis TaxID=3390026 RepID=UPI0011875C46|nr:hypothetical protein [Xanthomonas translucens]UKE77998.1 hypothetical protein KM317_01690 [Xanthomonas translucens pv. arrhenatheri]